MKGGIAMLQFDLFGDVTLKQETKEKKETEKKAPEKKGNANKSIKPTPTYRGPVKIYTGFSETTIEGNLIDENKVKEAAGELLNCPAKLIELFTKKGNKNGTELEAYVTTYTKGNPEELDGYELRYGNITMQARGKVKDSVKAFSANSALFIGADVVCDKKEKIAYIVPKGDRGNEKVTFPFSYSMFGQAENVFDPKDSGDDDDVIVDDGDTDEDEKDKEWTVSDVLDELKKVYNVGLSARKIGDTYILFPCSRGTAASKYEPKKSTYPTENVSLSLLLRHIPLNPDMFGGKKVIDDDDIFNWLTPQHPEVTKDTASFTFDDTNRLIICRLRSASKG